MRRLMMPQTSEQQIMHDLRDPEQVLIQHAAQWGVSLPNTVLAQFRLYAEALLRYNEHTNLTAITDLMGVYVRHFLDSLALAPYLGTTEGSLIDLGTGAGFPGVPLKLLYPGLRLCLVDSVGKKTAFLAQLVDLLALTQVRVLTERAEAVGRLPREREQYDLVTARAMAELRVLLEYGLPLLRVGGRMLAPKGADAAGEVAAADQALRHLGGRVDDLVPVQLPGLEPRSLVVITKIAPTPARYPRPVGVPTRRPL